MLMSRTDARLINVGPCSASCTSSSPPTRQASNGTPPTTFALRRAALRALGDPRWAIRGELVELSR